MIRTWCCALAVLVLFLSSNSEIARAESFKSGKFLPVANPVAYVLSADINRDGKADLVYLTSTGSGASNVTTIEVALGNGDGTFAEAQAIPSVAQSMGSVSQFSIADVNHDGNPDLIVVVNTLTTTAQLATFLGKGDGTFQAPIFSTGPTSSFLDTFLNGRMGLGDFDGDGVTDIVVADVANDTLSFLKGDNQGHFILKSTWADLNNPHDVHAVDLNGDGRLDFVAQGFLSSSTMVYLGNGDGTFQARATYTGPHNTGSVVVQDMNHDGRPDLVVSGFNNTVDILLNHGDGTFSNTSAGGVSYGGYGPAVVAIEDFDGDGTLDIAVLSANGIGTLRGLGGLTYADPKEYPAGAASVTQAPSLPAVGDFNGDGHDDFAIATADGIALLFGRADGTVQAADAYDTRYQVSSVTVGDFNGDKIGDLAIGLAGRSPWIAIGKSDGTFEMGTDQTQSLGNIYTSNVISGDFNGDHKTDVLIGQGASNLLEAGNGDGTFGTAAAFAPNAISGSFFSADFNNDGVADIATYTGQGVVFLTAKPDHSYVEFDANLPTENPGFVGAFAFADVNHDGKIDAIFNTDSGGQLGVYLGNGDGTFVTGRTYTISFAATTSFALGDVDGDGNIDIIVASGVGAQGPPIMTAGAIGVLYGNGDGTFQAEVTFATAHPVSAIAVGDFSQDGIADVVTSDGTVVTVMNGTRSRTFEKGRDYLAGDSAVSPVVADVNGDGGLDLVFADAQVNAVTTATVLLNLGVTTGQLTASPNPAVYGQPISLTASFAPTVAVAGVPTGTISFTVGGDALGNAPLQDGSASLTGAALAPVGRETVKANYAGDDTFNVHALSTTITVTKADSSLSLSAAPLVAVIGQKVTLTAHVSPQFAGVPTGTVTFQPSTGAATTKTLDGGGTATLGIDTSMLALGSYSYTASYAGDGNFNASSTASASQFTVANFNVTVTPGAVTVGAGGTGTVNVSVATTTGFNGSVDLSCTGLPATVRCSFSPAAVSLANTSSGSSVMTVAAEAGAVAPMMNWKNPLGPIEPGKFELGLLAAVLALVVFALSGILRWRAVVSIRAIAAMAMIWAGCVVAGCGGGSGGGGGGSPAPVNYTVQVVATVHGSSPAISRMASVSVTVQ